MSMPLANIFIFSKDKQRVGWGQGKVRPLGSVIANTALRESY
jgi:hypothetical protein